MVLPTFCQVSNRSVPSAGAWTARPGQEMIKIGARWMSQMDLTSSKHTFLMFLIVSSWTFIILVIFNRDFERSTKHEVHTDSSLDLVWNLVGPKEHQTAGLRSQVNGRFAWCCFSSKSVWQAIEMFKKKAGHGLMSFFLCGFILYFCSDCLGFEPLCLNRF